MTVPNFTSKVFSYQDLCIAPWGMIRQKHPGQIGLRQLEMNMYSNQHFINLVEWFCLNVKLRLLGFLILQILQMSKLSFISTNFAVDFLFSSGLLPLASNFELKKMLKSSAKIVYLFWLLSKFLNRL